MIITLLIIIIAILLLGSARVSGFFGFLFGAVALIYGISRVNNALQNTGISFATFVISICMIIAAFFVYKIYGKSEKPDIDLNIKSTDNTGWWNK